MIFAITSGRVRFSMSLFPSCGRAFDSSSGRPRRNSDSASFSRWMSVPIAPSRNAVLSSRSFLSFSPLLDKGSLGIAKVYFSISDFMCAISLSLKAFAPSCPIWRSA